MEPDPMHHDELTTALGALREVAPPTVLTGTLVATGLADGFFSHPGPLGDLFVAFNPAGVSSLSLAEDAEQFQDWFHRTFERPVVAVDRPPAGLVRRLERALAEGRPGSLPLDLRSITAFQVAVLRKAAEIPRGEVRPYGWVAKEIGRPGAVRAVGTALARNPVPLVVPCHRVIRHDGTLGRYSLGDARKRDLLQMEGVDTDQLEADAAAGRRLTGSDTTRIFCHPSCRNARRVTERHRVWFSDRQAAEQAGYRGCRVCRPAA